MHLDFQEDFRECWDKIEEVGKLYAKSKAVSWHAQELKSSILASIINKQDAKSHSKAESMAKASEEYKTFLKETSEKIEIELCLKAELDKWKAKFEGTRSLSSLEKSQINSEGHL